jgi:hypothetical protein
MTNWGLEELPLNIDLETKRVLKALPGAHAALAELKGIAQLCNRKYYYNA